MIRYERQYCDECMCVHWVQAVNRNHYVCHGVGFIPKDTATHYTRWRSAGIELVEKVGVLQPVSDWLFAGPQEREPIDQNQDW